VLLADQLGVDPSAPLEQVYLGILRGGERPAAAASAPAGLPGEAERAEARAPDRLPAAPMPSPLTSFVGRDEDIVRVPENLRGLAWSPWSALAAWVRPGWPPRPPDSSTRPPGSSRWRR
jgi:hypothetical protein